MQALLLIGFTIISILNDQLSPIQKNAWKWIYAKCLYFKTKANNDKTAIYKFYTINNSSKARCRKTPLKCYNKHLNLPLFSLYASERKTKIILFCFP